VIIGFLLKSIALLSNENIVFAENDKEWITVALTKIILIFNTTSCIDVMYLIKHPYRIRYIIFNLYKRLCRTATFIRYCKTTDSKNEHQHGYKHEEGGLNEEKLVKFMNLIATTMKSSCSNSEFESVISWNEVSEGTLQDIFEFYDHHCKEA
jgi:hypothetical protein